MKLFVALLAIAAFVAPHAIAVHCKGPNLDRESEDLRVTDPTTGTLYYIENDACQTEGCAYHVYVYEETNGYPNLQRQDASPLKANKWTQDDTCHGKIRPDTVVL